MSKEKVLIINHFSEVSKKDESLILRDGISVHSYNVAKRLVPDYEVVVFSPGGESFSHQGVRFINTGKSVSNSNLTIGNTEYFIELLNYIKCEDFDYIICHSGATAFLNFLSRSLNAVIIGVIHDFSTFSNEGLWVENIRKLDRIGLSNSHLKEKLINKYNFPSDDLKVVGNGVDLKEYSLGEEKKNQILFIGRLVKSKRVKQLVKAFHALQQEDEGLELVLVGTGVMKEEIRNYVKEEDVHDVRILSDVTEAEKIKLLQESKIYASFSQIEGFGIPLIEGMSCGAVPVVSDIKAHGFVFQSEKVGYLVNNEEEWIEKVEELLHDEELRQELVENGRRLVEEKWSWRGVTERYEELFQSVQERKEVDEGVKDLKIEAMKLMLKPLLTLFYDLGIIEVKNCKS